MNSRQDDNDYDDEEGRKKYPELKLLGIFKRITTSTNQIA